MYKMPEKTWDSVWLGDSYSESGLRSLKAKQKISHFEKTLNLDDTSTCVDLGCGGGYISQEISLKYGCKVIGVDFSKEAICRAKENFEHKEGKCNFISGSVLNIPLPENTADAVLCIGVLEHVEDIMAALKEISRILKPNAPIVVISSNLYSIIYIDRLIKKFSKTWKYGYQKNWSSHAFCKKLKTIDIEVFDEQILQGFGDFQVKNAIDIAINKIIPQWGRYFMVSGRNRKK